MGEVAMIQKTEVRRIESKETYDFILTKHYAQRKPSISFAYGLYINDTLQGVATIGKPASNTLCEGVCGVEYKQYVYELNRLITNDGLPPNTLSKFISTVLNDLKSEKIIIVSYADEGVGHHGYIYQATNWIYTGKTKGRTDKYVPNGKHSRHYTEEWNHLRKFRTEKHRYLYIPNKRFKKECLKILKYPIVEQYPKGDNSPYVLGERAKQKILNTTTNEVFYE